AERLEAERREAERLEAERLEAERREAERLAAVPVTAGAIMAAEIAHAVTTGNTESLNIAPAKFDTGNISLDGKTLTGDPMVDEQISGQLSLLDIMNEWEETKKANEEKRIAQMREKVMKQTGPMFSNFDEVARASVASNLDLINPVVDVFKHDEAIQEQKPVQDEEFSIESKEELIPEASVEKEEETKKALNKKAKKLKKYIKKAFYNEAIKVFSNEIVNGEKSNIIDVDANILMLHMLYKKGNKKTEIMMNNLTDKSIVSVDVIPLSDDKITEFVSVCKKFKMENLIKPELEKHKGNTGLLEKALI
ncbi:MAG: hypothetical protein IIW72_01810, partial [Clostridia bacterium]|nr:hypothetical protein [Clostridia bacterium]